MERQYLKGVECPRRHSSYMACSLGAARYLGYAGTESWVYGASGMAFFSHVALEGMCYAYPTDWRVGKCFALMRNAGISHDPLPVPDGDVPQAVKHALSNGVPVHGWSDVAYEQILVRGYADTPQGETIKYLGPSEEKFHPWSLFDDGPTQVSLVPPADDRITVRMALQCAVDMSHRPNDFHGAKTVMGGEAFRVTADWLDKKEKLEGDFGYNIQVWEECRRNAVAFLAEANNRLADDKLRERFKEAEQHVTIVHKELKAIVDTFGDLGVPLGKHDEYAQHLRKACEAEKKTIEAIEAILKLMK